MITKAAIVLLGALLGTGIASAAQVTQAEVTHKGGVYRVTFAVTLDADVERVRRIVTDYDRLHELSPVVVHSRVISRDGGRTRLDLLLRSCVLRVFCRSMRKITDATVTQDGGIHHRTVASMSDFSYAEETLSLRAGPGHQGTQAGYQAELVPKFFVPPIIGPWLVRRQIIRELKETAIQVERVAAGSVDR